MKVAIVHDYIKEYGGAERVLESLHNVFPDAPVYTSVYLPQFLGPHRPRFQNWNIKTSWAQNLPFKAKLISPLRLIAPRLFRGFDFSEYDAVIVSATGAYCPNTIKKGNAKQISYVHTPPRYLYGYETARDWKKNALSRAIGTIVIHWLRIVDFKSSQNVDLFIANSQETKRRIEKFYRKNAVVIYPPVDVKSFPKVKKGDYFLTGGRIARAKHPELIIKAFLENELPLKIFGKSFGGYEQEIKDLLASKKSNIEYLGEISDDEKSKLMAGARAFVFASQDEDFGIVPVEAMMAGTPVIAHRSGGVVETVIEGKTGVFFDELTPESINKAINKFKSLKLDSQDCINQSRKFSKEKFEKEIKELVEKYAGTTRS